MPYGGQLVTEKYQPLDDVQYSTTQRDLYSALMTHRSELLTNAHILPQPLSLRTDWTAAIAAERAPDRLPPLVVISTNRSSWIAAGILACTEQLKHKSFTVAHDLNALTDIGLVGQAPPLYAPRRIGPNRSVYIIVHLYEYQQYREALAGLGMNVVGWHFQPPPGGPIGHLTGFGASRFAAIEFCKQLRTQAGNPWNYAWLLDDNVVGITSWPGFATFERAMAAAPTRACAGFKGGTKAEDHADLVKWATKEVDAKPTRAIPTAVPRLEPKGGLVQQASLWNIAYLTTNHLNFGPAFINSAEDVSISKYFDLTGTHYFFYDGAKVRKESPRSDGSAGAAQVKKAREAYTKWVIKSEARDIAGQTPPPPVFVKLAKEKKDDPEPEAQRLSKFIRDWFNSASPPPVEGAKNYTVQHTAKCHAVEQIIAEALGLGSGYFKVEALTASLKINGANAQEVVRINL